MDICPPRGADSLRAGHKRDLGSSPAELVFGDPLRLPGQFFSPANARPARKIVRRLNTDISRLRPAPTAGHSCHKQPFVSPDLSTAAHVFMRAYPNKPPLTPPYVVPYAVISGGREAFVLNQRGRQETIAVDRLKPAYLERTAKRASDHARHVTLTGSCHGAYIQSTCPLTESRVASP